MRNNSLDVRQWPRGAFTIKAKIREKYQRLRKPVAWRRLQSTLKRFKRFHALIACSLDALPKLI
jgi:hypothetical protein